MRQFAAERDWDQFHTPKNLAMALVAEAGELAAEFQWLTACAKQRAQRRSSWSASAPNPPTC